MAPWEVHCAASSLAQPSARCGTSESCAALLVIMVILELSASALRVVADERKEADMALKSPLVTRLLLYLRMVREVAEYVGIG